VIGTFECDELLMSLRSLFDACGTDQHSVSQSVIPIVLVGAKGGIEEH